MSASNGVVHPEVLEAYSRDVGHGIARLDKMTMNNLNIKEGDILKIQGKRRTVAKCLPLYPSDEGNNIIRIDGIIRNNAGIEIGNVITVSKDIVETYPAIEITLKPLADQDELLKEIQQVDDDYIANCLDEIPLIHDDNIAIPLRCDNTENSNDKEYVFFQIIETYPSGIPIIIDKKTVFNIVDYVFLKKSKYSEFLEILKEKLTKGEITKDEFLRMRNDLGTDEYSSTKFKKISNHVKSESLIQSTSSIYDWAYMCLAEAKMIIQKYHTNYDTTTFFQNTTYDLFEQTDREDAYGYITIRPKSNHFSIGIHPILLEKNQLNERMLIIILVHELLHAIHDREGWGHERINPLERKLANLAGYFDALIEMENLAINGRMHFCNE